MNTATQKRVYCHISHIEVCIIARYSRAFERYKNTKYWQDYNTET